jgi:hypothetical protein
MTNQHHQLTYQFANLTEYELRRAFLTAAKGPRESGNHFFNQFEYKHALFRGNPASTLLNGLDLLNRCYAIDQAAFSSIHKGSAYYWIGMAAWLMRNHELATFFFDAAVSEDIRAGHNPNNNLSPSLRYMLLDGESDEQAAKDLVQANQARMKELIADYNARTGLPQRLATLTIGDVRDRFLKKAISAGGENLRSSASTLISFCMEWDLRNMLFDIRPIHGTAEPFFLHLFKGCLLFESLLIGNTVNPPSEKSNLRVALQHLHRELGIPENINIGNTDFPSIIANLADADESIQTAIRITGQVRNTLGHNLGWVVNLDKAQYHRLFRMVSSSFLHAISCLYL